jgi:exopolysaccharide/PEP-CTERM locus tyrosine autokinase
LLPPEHQERALSDQYRQIKRPLIANATGRGGTEKLPRGQLIMVASAMPGEGKTFTSMNLALSLALEKDLSVLLIDADAPKPHLDRALGIAGEPGLLELLRDESLDPESLIIPTDVPTLAMLPIGTGSETTTELLASHRMEEIMAQLASNDPMRIVVIDSPPLLLTSESRVLAEAAGQVVLVVRAGVTPQQAVLDAISHLGEGKSIGLLLNQSTDIAPAGYYYGYGDSKS